MNNSKKVHIKLGDESFDACMTSDEIKQKMVQLDKKRIGFKPEKIQNQWSRVSQNSGNEDKKTSKSKVSSGSIDLLFSSEENEPMRLKYKSDSDDSSTITEGAYTLREINDPKENVYNYPIVKSGNKLYISIPNQLQTTHIYTETSSLENQPNKPEINNDNNDDTQGDCADEIGDSLHIEI